MAGVYANETVLAADFTDLIGGTPSYTDIGELVNVSFGGFTADSLDTTVHGDTWRQRIPGLKDGGTIDATVRFGPQTHAALLDNVGVLCAWKVTFPKETSTNTVALQIEVDGFITSLGTAAPHDGLLEATLTIQVSGAPDITDEAAA